MASTTPIQKPIRFSEIRDTFSRLADPENPVSLSEYQGLSVARANPSTGAFAGYAQLPGGKISLSDFENTFDFNEPYIQPAISINSQPSSVRLTPTGTNISLVVQYTVNFKLDQQPDKRPTPSATVIEQTWYSKAPGETEFTENTVLQKTDINNSVKLTVPNQQSYDGWQFYVDIKAVIKAPDDAVPGAPNPPEIEVASKTVTSDVITIANFDRIKTEPSVSINFPASKTLYIDVDANGVVTSEGSGTVNTNLSIDLPEDVSAPIQNTTYLFTWELERDDGVIEWTQSINTLDGTVVDISSPPGEYRIDAYTDKIVFSEFTVDFIDNWIVRLTATVENEYEDGSTLSTTTTDNFRLDVLVREQTLTPEFDLISFIDMEPNDTAQVLVTARDYLGDTLTWELSKAGEKNDFFGHSIAAGNGKVVVGAYGDDSARFAGGAFYLYDSDLTNVVKITTDNAADPTAWGLLGRPVAIGENKLVISAYADNAPGVPGFQGAVYVYDLDGSNELKITATDYENVTSFGYCVAVGEGKIAIGNGQFRKVNNTYVYVYDLDGSNEIVLSPPEGFSGSYTNTISDAFGSSVAITNGRIIVSDRLYRPGNTYLGALHIYDLNGEHVKSIRGPGSFYGSTIAASDGKLAVTASTTSGKVFLYNFNLEEPMLEEIAVLEPDAPLEESRFGESLAFGQDFLVIGAPGYYNGIARAGAVYIYDLEGNRIKILQSPKPRLAEGFGKSVAVINDTILVGAWGHTASEEYNGTLYVFDLDGNLQKQIFIEQPVDSGVFKTTSGSISLSGSLAEKTGTFTFQTEVNIAEDTGALLTIFDDSGKEVAYSTVRVTAGEAPSYSISPSSVAIEEGQTVTFTITSNTPNTAVNYTVDYEELQGIAGNIGSDVNPHFGTVNLDANGTGVFVVQFNTEPNFGNKKTYIVSLNEDTSVKSTVQVTAPAAPGNYYFILDPESITVETGAKIRFGVRAVGDIVGTTQSVNFEIKFTTVTFAQEESYFSPVNATIDFNETNTRYIDVDILGVSAELSARAYIDRGTPQEESCLILFQDPNVVKSPYTISPQNAKIYGGETVDWVITAPGEIVGSGSYPIIEFALEGTINSLGPNDPYTKVDLDFTSSNTYTINNFKFSEYDTDYVVDVFVARNTAREAFTQITVQNTAIAGNIKEITQLNEVTEGASVLPRMRIKSTGLAGKRIAIEATDGSHNHIDDSIYPFYIDITADVQEFDFKFEGYLNEPLIRLLNTFEPETIACTATDPDGNVFDFNIEVKNAAPTFIIDAPDEVNIADGPFGFTLKATNIPVTLGEDPYPEYSFTVDFDGSPGYVSEGQAFFGIPTYEGSLKNGSYDFSGGVILGDVGGSPLDTVGTITITCITPYGNIEKEVTLNPNPQLIGDLDVTITAITATSTSGCVDGASTVSVSGGDGSLNDYDWSFDLESITNQSDTITEDVNYATNTYTLTYCSTLPGTNVAKGTITCYVYDTVTGQSGEDTKPFELTVEGQAYTRGSISGSTLNYTPSNGTLSVSKTAAVENTKISAQFVPNINMGSASSRTIRYTSLQNAPFSANEQNTQTTNRFMSVTEIRAGTKTFDDGRVRTYQRSKTGTFKAEVEFLYPDGTRTTDSETVNWTMTWTMTEVYKETTTPGVDPDPPLNIA